METLETAFEYKKKLGVFTMTVAEHRFKKVLKTPSLVIFETKVDMAPRNLLFLTLH